MTDPYREGMNARRYSDNPYEENTNAFDLFERGFTQKLKRMSTDELNRLAFEEEPAKKEPFRSYKEAKDGF